MVMKNGIKRYSVGIAIRTYNEAEFLGKCLHILKSQNMERIESIEILIIDSYSTDGTIEIANREGCSMIEIPKKDFNYGGSLNTGIEALNTELIVCLSAHAIPQSKDFLDEMVKFFDNDQVAGVYVKQDPWPEALFIEKVRINRTFDTIFRNFSSKDDINLHFSNVASCIRRTNWENHHFLAIPSSEDYYWAQEMLAKGNTIIYNPVVAVFHSHKDTCPAFARRFYNILKNDLVANKRNPASEFLRVMRAGASHIKFSLQICISEKGGVVEKLVTIIRSIIECFLIIFYHIKYKFQ